jgi:hypothetical protein
MQQLTSLKAIRIWEGTQHRAFEELCYQLLREPEDLPTSGATPVRTANPDGGVEWYVDLDDGSQWGWQAKFIDDLEDLLKSMRATVKRVVAERPNLTRLTFCIHENLTTGTRTGQNKSQRQRYADAVAAWKVDFPGASGIEFVLIDQSELLRRLVLPKHAGRRFFWFSQPHLGLETLGEIYQQQSLVAGRRYRPLLQVDIPIEFDLQALGFGKEYFNALDRHRLAFLHEARWVRKLDAAFGADVVAKFDLAIEAIQQLRECFASFTALASRSDPLDRLVVATKAALEALSGADSEVYAFERRQSAASSDEQKKRYEKLRSDSYPARKTLRSIEELDQFLQTPASDAVRRRAYFLTGDAGSGKTHLLLDSVNKALRDSRPAVVLFGARFGMGNLWQSIAEQLDLPPLGPTEVLGAMSACAEACSLDGRRFVLAIDAVNETPEPSFWSHHLPALAAEVARWPNVALIVSCRTTYLPAVDPDKRRDALFVQRSHPGFAGREVEATHKYFQHFKLPEPRIPLLLPEFTVPLFLQLYCESLANSSSGPPDHHESRIEVFKRFVDSKVDQAARRVRPDAIQLEHDTLVIDISSALSRLLRDCIATGREVVAKDQLAAIGNGFVPQTNVSWIQIVSVLESEGVLTSDLHYLDGQETQVLRISFQAFADYLILRERIGAATPAQVRADVELKTWLANASFGILDAAAVLLPELYGVELPDYLTVAGMDERKGVRRSRRGWYQEFVGRTLPYRSATSISDRTIDIFNSWLRDDRGQRFFDVLFLLAPQPSHRLNGDGLHRYLSGMSMPRRDQWFGIKTYHDLLEEGSAAARLARWAAGGPYPMYDATVVELACVPLVWLLSSPNRFTRDWTTKALVQLLRGHSDVLLRLLHRFRTVNDPYVWERLVTIAYGAVMRASDPKSFVKVAEFASAQVFGDIDRFRPDALMFDSAQGIVEWGVVNGLLPADDLKAARPPYAIQPPSRPWAQKRIETRYKTDSEKRPIEETYSSVYWSVMGHGDFGRYVIQSGLRNFSRVPLSAPKPTRDLAESEPRLNRRAWKTFVESLDDGQQDLLAATLDDSQSEADRQAAMSSFSTTLSQEQHGLRSSMWIWPRQKKMNETRYPADRAARWIFQRVVSLGWKPERFGSFDRARRWDDSGRSAHKAERFGKKYQWIAYHELLARIASNYHIDPFSWGPEGFNGLHQLNDREIDPSLPPIGYALVVGTEEGVRTAASVPEIGILPDLIARPSFPRTPDGAHEFITDQSAVPTALGLARTKDESGAAWVVLDGIFHAFDPETDEPDEYRGLEQWCHLNSWFVPSDTADRATKLLLKAVQDQVFELVDRHGHSDCCFLGEIGWHPAECPHRHLDSIELPDGKAKRIGAFMTTEDYSWSGSGFDCSINQSVSVTCPSAFLQLTSSIRWSGDGPIWLDDGQVVAGSIGRHGLDTSHVFVVREDWLRSFLKKQRLHLIVAARGERQRLAGEATYREARQEFASAVSFDSSGRFGQPTFRSKITPGQGDWDSRLQNPAHDEKNALAPVVIANSSDSTVEVLYFAYGSNMSTSRLVKRTGSIVERGIGRLEGRRLLFNKAGDGGAGKANISRRKGSEVWGVLFGMTRAQFKTLAGYEAGYVPQTVTVNVGNKPVEAQTFVAQKRTPGLKPRRTYVELLVVGAREHDLPEAYAKKLDSLLSSVAATK